MSESERPYPDPEDDRRTIVAHFANFVKGIRIEGYSEEHGERWEKMIEKMFREPTHEELDEAAKWNRQDKWFEERLARDITPDLLEAYQGGTIGWMKVEFVKLALQRPEIFNFTANSPEYMQEVLGYELIDEYGAHL